MAEIYGKFESGNYHDGVVMKEKDLQQCCNLNTMPVSVLGTLFLNFSLINFVGKLLNTIEFERFGGTFDTIVVMIEQGRIIASVGADTGFVLQKNRILTNTHPIFLTLQNYLHLSFEIHRIQLRF